jgi:hypothetical protein
MPSERLHGGLREPLQRPTSDAVNDRMKTGPIGNRQIYDRLKSLKAGEGLTVGRSGGRGGRRLRNIFNTPQDIEGSSR